MSRRPHVFLAYTEAEFAQAYDAERWDALTRVAEVRRCRGTQPLEGAALAREAQGCDAIVAFRSVPGRAETFDAMPGLVAFVRAAVDTSTIDVAAASRHGVLVTHVRPGFANAVAELGLGMMIDLARGITRQRLAPGEAPRIGRELSGAVMGLVGYGTIARQLHALANALGMRTLAFDPGQVDTGLVARVELDTLLSQSDFVVCLAASTPATRGLMDAQAFARMRRGAFFVNLSRGELVDEDALEAALDSGHLAGAALDVGQAADQKPSARFMARADVVASQHIGNSTAEARAFQTLETIRQIEALARGELPHGALNAGEATRHDTWMAARAASPRH
ncbi:MAG: hydroxyacid dehydrogenase [Burkholderiales bacterium]|nr:hydroxyacid dehydrogenase [Burkholderiales bacterium]